jgi:hypothetical protein
MRNEEYIDAHIRQLGLEKPYHPITINNQVDLGSPCRVGCEGCIYGAQSYFRPFDDIIHDIARVDQAYTRIEFYGGDAFLRDDLCALLDHVPQGKKIVVWTMGNDIPGSTSFAGSLRTYPIEAIKVHFPIPFREDGTYSHREDEIERAFRKVASLSLWGIPVHLYMPMDLLAQNRSVLATVIPKLRIERLYGYTKDCDDSLTNSVACFGRGMGHGRILWVSRGS